MVTTGKNIFADEDVSGQILGVLRDAGRYVVFVTPYISLWGHAKTAISLAKKRGISIIFMVRADKEIVDGPDVAWLLSSGIDVRSVVRLHAKIYLNESTTILSSMNLLESSSKNSLEIGIVVKDLAEENSLRGYVDSTLLNLAKPLGQPIKGKVSTIKSDWNRTWEDESADKVMQSKKPSTSRKSNAAVKKGFCIRCKTGLELDIEKPYCRDHYKSWERYKDRSYKEQFCHRCGKENETSMEKPLCYSCYQAGSKKTTTAKDRSIQRLKA